MHPESIPFSFFLLERTPFSRRPSRGGAQPRARGLPGLPWPAASLAALPLWEGPKRGRINRENGWSKRVVFGGRFRVRGLFVSCLLVNTIFWGTKNAAVSSVESSRGGILGRFGACSVGAFLASCASVREFIKIEIRLGVLIACNRPSHELLSISSSRKRRGRSK